MTRRYSSEKEPPADLPLSAAAIARPTRRKAAIVSGESSISLRARWISTVVQPGKARLLDAST